MNYMVILEAYVCFKLYKMNIYRTLR